MSMNEVIGNAMTMDNLSEEVRALFCEVTRPAWSLRRPGARLPLTNSYV